MKQFLSLKVTRQGLADAFVVPSIILATFVLSSDNSSLSYTLGLSCLIFWRMDDDLWAEFPVFCNFMYWTVLLIQVFTHGTYFLAAKFL